MRYFRKPVFSLLLVISVMAMTASCEKGPNFKTYTYPKQTVTGMHPTSGYVYSYDTINGSNFDTLVGAVKVYFGGIKADTVVSCVNNQIVVKVPKNAATGKVAVQVWTNIIDSIGTYTVIK